MAHHKDVNEVAIGFVPIYFGRDEPRFRMDPSGKLIYTRNHHILSKPLYSFQTIADPFSESIICYVCSVFFLLLSLLIVFIFKLSY
jgi:hypothetical protein